MRRKRLAQQGITMVHIDAHPDLCVTEDMQADICFQPRALYDALDNSVGGIAEWIIPLVYEGHLDTIWWLRPPWADQFTDGTYALGVGKSQATGCLVVATEAPYYVDDRSHCARALMSAVRDAALHVAALPALLPSEHRSDAGARVDGDCFSAQQCGAAAPRTAEHVCCGGGDGAASQQHAPLGASEPDTAALPPAPPPLSASLLPPGQWGLDICLDYFATNNPFLEQLVGALGEAAARTVVETYRAPVFRGARTPLPHAEQVRHEARFFAAVAQLLRLDDSGETDDDGSAAQQSGDGSAQHATPLVTLQGVALDGAPPALGMSESGATAAAVEGAPAAAPHCDGSVAAARDAAAVADLAALCPPGRGAAAARAFAALARSLPQPSRALIADAACCAATLPAARPPRAAQARAVDELRALLAALLPARPAVITVARSADDGYTPRGDAAWLEAAVLRALADVYGPLSRQDDLQ